MYSEKCFSAFVLYPFNPPTRRVLPYEYYNHIYLWEHDVIEFKGG